MPNRPVEAQHPRDPRGYAAFATGSTGEYEQRQASSAGVVQAPPDQQYAFRD